MEQLHASVALDEFRQARVVKPETLHVFLPTAQADLSGHVANTRRSPAAEHQSSCPREHANHSKHNAGLTVWAIRRGYSRQHNASATLHLGLYYTAMYRGPHGAAYRAPDFPSTHVGSEQASSHHQRRMMPIHRLPVE